MSINKSFEEMLSGGHPNSLGKTVEVVDLILADKARLDELYQCYFSKDEVVRLRVSNAMKRICKVHPEWLVPYINRLIFEISKIKQASTQWTLAQLYLMLGGQMSMSELEKAKDVLKTNLETSDDWIVQNMTIETLSEWAKDDNDLKEWVVPRLEVFAVSDRKSVAGRAKKMLDFLAKE